MNLFSLRESTRQCALAISEYNHNNNLSLFISNL